jgi:hypothetical protein
MNQLPSNKKEILTLAGFVILNLLVLLFGGWLLMVRIIENNQQLKEKKGALAVIEKNWQEIKLGEDALGQIKPELEKADRYFISMKDPVRFINALESLAQKTNNFFEINLAAVNQSAGPEEKSGLPFQVYLAGSFPDLLRFLNYLENMDYYIKIESIHIEQLNSRNAGKPQLKELPAESVYSIINLKAFTGNGN